jgi:hypothetical protein
MLGNSQQVLGAGGRIVPRDGEGLREMRAAPFAVGKPLFDLGGRLFGAAVGVAIRAGVWRNGLGRQIWPWNAEAVVASTVDPHINPLDHVAAHALRTR